MTRVEHCVNENAYGMPQSGQKKGSDLVSLRSLITCSATGRGQLFGASKIQNSRTALGHVLQISSYRTALRHALLLVFYRHICPLVIALWSFKIFCSYMIVKYTDFGR